MAEVKNSPRRAQRGKKDIPTSNPLTPSSPPAWEGWLTPEQRVNWQEYAVRLGSVVGEAVEMKENGTKVLENERLRNGLCRLRLSRYGTPPSPPLSGTKMGGEKVLELRWRDEDVPMFYLYLVWMEAVNERSKQ